MSPFTQRQSYSRNWKARNVKRLRHLENMRAAKERKRLANPVEREPVMQRYHPLEWAVRDKRNGDVVWMPLRSVREVSRKVAVVLKYYLPG